MPSSLQRYLPKTQQGRLLLLGGGLLATYAAVQIFLRPVTGWSKGFPKLIFLKSIGNGQSLARNVANDFLAMQAAAARDGVKLIPNSGFRSMASQTFLYAAYVKRAFRAPKTARPGFSNHQAGEAVDIQIPPSDTAPNSAARIASREYQWLRANAAKFGFFNDLAATEETWHWSRTGR